MKVAIYARVSTSEQETDNQLIRLREVARNRGWTVYKEYVDVASGRNANRPALNDMLRDAKKHSFDKIIAVKLDRIARNTINLCNMIQDLALWNVGIEFLDQPIDTSSPSGKLTIVILGAIAEFERELIVERTKDGLNRARKEGKTLGKPKSTLSDYQRDKARRILAENPDISTRKLAEQFDGISRMTLIKLLKEDGIL